MWTGNDSVKSPGSSDPSTWKLKSDLRLDAILEQFVDLNSSGGGFFLCRSPPRTTPPLHIRFGATNYLRKLFQCVRWNLHPNQFTAFVVEDNWVGIVPAMNRKHDAVLLPHQEMAGLSKPPFARVWNRRLILETVLAVQFSVCSRAGGHSKRERDNAQLE